VNGQDRSSKAGDHSRSIPGTFRKYHKTRLACRYGPYAYQSSSPAIRREIVLASSSQTGADWARQHLSELSQMDVWLQRSFFYAMRHLPDADRRAYAIQNPVSGKNLMTNSLLGLLSVGTAIGDNTGSVDGAEVGAPTIGIITALPKELAAVKAQLQNPQRVTAMRQGGMRECYVGELSARDGGQHVVAVALSGMGNNQASARATNLVRDFPTIKHVIMTGIAGGVPNPDSPTDHVRLGDIVVSGEHGVVQYDIVKDSGVDVSHRNPPRPPSSAILEAVGFLESDSLTGHRPYYHYIDEGLKPFNSKRPADKSDALTETGEHTKKIRHPRDSARERGHPRLFVGPIASANILLKDAAKRDLIRDRFGVKAVEMEGSGIADATWDLEIGYLVLRGICDYCDGNKNDGWQVYAAVAAAAYTRALLESIPGVRTR
jgi:nucleoside phosphorylase